MRFRDRWIPLLAPRWIIASIVALFIALALVAFFVLPDLMVADKDFTIAGERIKAENDIRTTGLQFLGGAVLALGALFTGVALVYNRESQLTERFTRAIDQLGHAKTDIRVGGIYALERIAKDSRRDQAPVMEILITHVKENARLTEQLKLEDSQKVAADIQAALTVIKRRNTSRERDPFLIDLSDTNLARADLSRGAFTHSDFSRACLVGANLAGADLERAVLEGADCRDAYVGGADLLGASCYALT
jgi:hypothetical protein